MPRLPLPCRENMRTLLRGMASNPPNPSCPNMLAKMLAARAASTPL
jgi:hypothetical protein